DFFISMLGDKKTDFFIEASLFESEVPKNVRIFRDNNKEGYLHEKFIIFDGKAVLFGTGNFTENSLKNDFNVFVYTQNPIVTALFLEEINNFQNNRYGHDKSIIDRQVKADGCTFRMITGPSVNIYKSLIKEIQNSSQSIDIFSFSFTDPFMVYELEKASASGVKIRMVSDDWNLMYSSPIQYLKGIEVVYDPGVHAKIMVLDNKKLVIGSYNLTYRAREKNDEFLVIVDDSKLVSAVREKFELYFKEEK
ncbi:MAG TPA: phosphatidylserine/phosphatidylglycerophosphate/cardiolipin synthase family protein, partial [Petrotogaceae bacterium]|nr:phosphatidylserine/phosphatidylglycerophosphate/cardiolipin synthase family protein [Petrotogaceae bacterium]